ncbi:MULTISPECIES: hypothetical protein [Streptococcus]|uniref:hypothetical protein n=1 Tax=Streptococcus TaxID=1301 RepID=UPI0010A183D8|nr:MULTISPECIES: hypothetical protein [Streptococcus]UMY67901.1 hypothetical protein ML603_08455 [Streptococcus dysgalactiae subsp. equisimilis]VGT79137.1 Uncharacterised protein [Streptococcus pyogenes]VGU04886.1 Uncharacterised protein [Streptococcus pyogenes]HEP1432997.1 hypothetical protein [Streptococcus pyogenes]HEP1467800.1 hypothetical protein [Streptococcus pyogenes]
MEIKDMKVNVDVRIKLSNSEAFREMVREFNTKAHELSLIAHELEIFVFEGEIENRVLSDDSNEQSDLA